MRKPNKHELIIQLENKSVFRQAVNYLQEFKNGRRVIAYFEDGTIANVHYLKTNIHGGFDTHKDIGWAYIWYEKDSKYGVVYEKCVDGKISCLTGPAKMRKHNPLECGKTTYEYWIYDQLMSREEWEAHPLVIAALVDRKLGE